LFELLSCIPENENKKIVEVMYHSLIDYRNNKKEKTVTNNGAPKTGRDYMFTELTELAESSGFTWSLRKASFHEYIIFHHTATNIIYLFITESSLDNVRKKLSEIKQAGANTHYFEGWVFINDQWSNSSVKDRPGQLIADYGATDEIVLHNYEELCDLKRSLLMEYNAELCVFITYTAKKYELVNVKAIIPSSSLENEFLHVEDWGHFIPVLYDGGIIEANELDLDEIDLEFQDGVLNEQDDIQIDIDQDDKSSDSES